jgi:hypothetical protein
MNAQGPTPKPPLWTPPLPRPRSAAWGFAAFFLISWSAGAQTPQTIPAGLWQFTSQSDTLSLSSGSQVNGSFTNCIDPARTVPVDPLFSCQVNDVNRNGAVVRWASTCTTPQGTFRSQGVAQYSGDAMTGTLSTYVPIIGAQITQRIYGRYIGSCRS